MQAMHVASAPRNLATVSHMQGFEGSASSNAEGKGSVPRLDTATTRRYISELAEESSSDWDERDDARADALAVHYGTVRHVAWLVGTAQCVIGLGLTPRTMHAYTTEDLALARTSAMRLYAPDVASQVVQRAARRTDTRRPQQFEEWLRTDTWTEMGRLARGSVLYLQCCLQQVLDNDAVQRCSAAFLRFGSLKQIALLAMRESDSDEPALLSRDEIAQLGPRDRRGRPLQATSVEQARSRARDKLRAPATITFTA